MSGDRCRCKSTGVASRSAEEFVRCHTRLRVRTLAGEKNNFCDAQTHINKERRASARRGVVQQTYSYRSGGQPAVGVSMVIATEYVFVESGVRQPAVVRASGLAKELWQSRGRLPAVS
jgi:hypothetical protein